MFLRVIQGRVPDRTAMRAQHEAWAREIGPGVSGWRGAAAGITEDDRFICLSWFQSVEAFARLEARSDQREWWARTERLFLGPVVATEFPEVSLLLDGLAAEAGFVQVVQGRAADPARLRTLEQDLLRYLPDGRPDILGGLAAVGPDGRFIQAFSFSSEELARAGEHGEQLPEIEEIFADLRELTGEPTYHDLRHPWIAAPAPSGEARCDGERTGPAASDAAAQPDARRTDAEKAGSRPWSSTGTRTTTRH